MRPDAMRKAFLVFFVVLTALFVAMTWPFAKAAFLAFTLAVIFVPVHRFIAHRVRLPRYFSATLTTILVAVCVVLPLAVLVGVVITQINAFLQGIVVQVEAGSFSEAVAQLLAMIHDWLVRFWGSAPPVEELQAGLKNAVTEAGKLFYELSPRVLSTTVSILVNFVLMLLFLVVFLAEGSGLYSWLMETTPLAAEHRQVFSREVRLTITTSIAAAVVTAAVQGLLLGLGFWVAGFAQVTGWMLIAAILSLIPVIGASSCYVVATAVLMASGNTKGAILFLLYGIVIVSGIDNVLKPLIVRGGSRMHPLLLFVVLVGGVKLVGPIGVLVGPVLLSIFLASLKIYRREFIQSQGV